MNRPVMTLLAACLTTVPALAQQPPAAPQPGAEHARIGYFAGTWHYEGTAQPSPMGPGGKITSTDVCEWFNGGFHLVCRSDATSPRGAAKGGAVWGYDPMQQAYTYYAHNSFGEAFYVTGNVSGKVWTWNLALPAQGGAPATQARVTLTEESPTAFMFKFEVSTDGTNWMAVEEGRSTKRR